MPRGEAGGAGPAHPGSQPPSPRVWGHKCLLCEPCRLRDAVCSCQLLRGTFLCHGQDHGHIEVFCTWPRRDSDSGRKPQLAPQSSASPVHGAILRTTKGCQKQIPASQRQVEPILLLSFIPVACRLAFGTMFPPHLRTVMSKAQNVRPQVGHPTPILSTVSKGDVTGDPRTLQSGLHPRALTQRMTETEQGQTVVCPVMVMTCPLRGWEGVWRPQPQRPGWVIGGSCIPTPPLISQGRPRACR